MFKALILQAQHNLSDAKMEFMIRDRLSWMRFLDFELGCPTPDENTIRHFRNRLTETGTLKRVMKAFDWQLQKKGYIPMSGQIVDASLVPAPKQRNTEDEKAAVKAGKTADEIWPNEPNKAVQKDVDARWTLKIGGKVRYRPDGIPLPMIAIPTFGYKSHISIDRRKPKGKPMPEATRRANARKSSIRAKVEHVFGHQKNRYGLFIRTIGLARAEAKLILANLAYNFDRLIFHERRRIAG